MKLDEKKLYRAIGEVNEDIADEAAPKSLSAEYTELMDFVPEQKEAPQRSRKITHIVTGVMTAAAACACIAAVTVLLPKLANQKPPVAGTAVTQETEPALTTDAPVSADALSYFETEKGWYVAECDPNAESVVIPESYQGQPVVGIRDAAFQNHDKLKKIVIPSTVNDIAGGAFDGTPWLKQQRAANPLVIVNGILIDAQTCSGAVTIPDGVTRIGENAFCAFLPDDKNFNHDLTAVTIPDSVKAIDQFAFYHCDKLESINLPAGLQEIGCWAFGVCSGLKEITIPANVKSIGVQAFLECSSLTKVTMLNGLSEIGGEAFKDCENLAEISIPESVSVFGGFAFTNTKWLQQKQAENPCVVVNGILINGSACTGAVTIPDGVRAIGDDAFSEFNAENPKLTSVVIPDSVTEIGKSAFGYCPNLESVELPAGLTVIEESTFTDCTSLRAIVIPDGVKRIECGAFMDCRDLESVEIPASVTEFDQSIFLGTKWLEQKRQENPLVTVNGVAIDGRACTGDVTIPEGVTGIVDCLLADKTEAVDVTIPESVTAISEGAFGNCDSITIKGKAGSAAEAYAQQANISFIAE